MLLCVFALLFAVVPYQPQSAEAGITFNFSLTCDGPNGVLSFTGTTTPGSFDVDVNGVFTANYPSNSTFQHTIPGPGSWLVEVFYYPPPFAPTGKVASQPDKTTTEKADRGEISPVYSANITCSAGVVTEVICFPDGRLNHNCAAPIAVYLVKDADGVSLDIWRILPDTSGRPEMFFTADDLEAAGDGLTVVGRSGNIVLYKLASGEYQINVWLGLKVYVIRFTMPDGAVSLETEIDLF